SFMRAVVPLRTYAETLGLLCVEEAQERCVLRQEGLDLGNAGARPVLHPGLAEVVLDLMEAALAHGRKYRHLRRTAPWAERLIGGTPQSHTFASIERESSSRPSCLALSGLLIVNPRSGNRDPTADDLAEEAGRLGIEVHALREGEDPAKVARAAHAEVLGVAGGDGSLARIAGVALERDLPLVCVPFGTRNHFARDLGLDRSDPFAALHAFRGAERRIDVGRASTRVFLNNVSLGLYAQLVRRREHHRGRRQAFARMRAWAVLLTNRTP